LLTIGKGVGENKATDLPDLLIKSGRSVFRKVFPVKTVEPVFLNEFLTNALFEYAPDFS
jgi:hypothetical protein